MFTAPQTYTTPRQVRYQLDRQVVNGFCINVPCNCFVTHPAPSLWVVWDRSRPSNDPAAWGTIEEVVAWIFREGR